MYPRRRGRRLGPEATGILQTIAKGFEFLDSLGNKRTLARSLFYATHRASSPYAPQFFKTVSRLKQEGFIRIGESRITLTPKGESALTRVTQATTPLHQPKWDGRWRVVIWDIPEKRRATRDIVRAHLKQLGFVGIQQSVWVTPWPCRQEIRAIRSTLDLNPGLLFFETDTIEGDDQLKRWFHLPENPAQTTEEQ